MSSIKKLMNLSGRKALVTGANGKLGRIISETLAELGADLFLVDLPSAEIEKLSNELKKTYEITVEYYYCDLGDEIQRNKMTNYIIDNDIKMNIIINNAAFLSGSELRGFETNFENQSIEAWRKVIEVNLIAVFDLCQKLSPILNNVDGANIINISSIYGVLAPNWDLYDGLDMHNPAAYSASKGGLIQLSKWLSTKLAPLIRVNCISPGGILRDQSDLFIKRYEKKTPLKRMATEEDFKGVIAFLSSDLSKYITGQNILVDGGWSVW
jgi:NAD(P)-dependent dehydrogenase (short-subunit alcohol dehydrogenase family)